VVTASAASSMTPNPASAMKAASSVTAFTTMASAEAFASMESHVGTRRHYTTAVEAAVVGMARPVVGAVIEVIVVVSFLMHPITTVPSLAKVLPITMLPIAKVTKVSIKIMVAVAEEENRRKAHVKR
jgi:hypothetical protein